MLTGRNLGRLFNERGLEVGNVTYSRNGNLQSTGLKIRLTMLTIILANQPTLQPPPPMLRASP